ncbi:MAG: class I SAM-dependent methyltransferase [Candidatus Aminicenantales bacterium]
MTGEEKYQVFKDRLRRRFLKHFRKAYRVLPALDKPRILDIGCGSGVPTMELARLSGGYVIGLDIDAALVERLKKKIEESALKDRVSALQCSMFEMDFPEKSFDIIWAEGSIFAIGFATGLREWQRFLKPGGFLVVHDEEGDLKEKTNQIPAQGYDLLHLFILDEKIWWDEYFTPLEKKIREIRAKWPLDPKLSTLLDVDQREIEMTRNNPQRTRSAYFIMKKKNSSDQPT